MGWYGTYGNTVVTGRVSRQCGT